MYYKCVKSNVSLVFLAMVEESIGEREREKFVEGLNSKVKLTLSMMYSYAKSEMLSNTHTHTDQVP